jgi:hypothetical protein
MSQLLSLGAINKLTGKYVYPKIANKKDEYICPECNKDIILVQGEIRVHHFRHKVDSINPCHHYSKPTESQIHKDAKMLMKTILENKTHIQFVRECVSCKISSEITLPEITEGSIITLEHRFNYEDELRIADVAHTLNGEIKGIYEICNTHKTCSEDRPEPWVEIDANSLLTLVNTNNEPLVINCIRCEKCEVCYNKNLCIRCDGNGFDDNGNICNIDSCPFKKEFEKKIKEYEKKIKNRSNCCACGGSGTSYWSDDCYGSCLECCCINCGEFDDDCECKYCKKCESSYMKDEEHKCYLCEKCGKYEQDESWLKDHCKECCNCGKITRFLRTNGKCGPCYDGSKL